MLRRALLRKPAITLRPMKPRIPTPITAPTRITALTTHTRHISTGFEPWDPNKMFDPAERFDLNPLNANSVFSPLNPVDSIYKDSSSNNSGPGFIKSMVYLGLGGAALVGLAGITATGREDLDKTNKFQERKFKEYFAKQNQKQMERGKLHNGEKIEKPMKVSFFRRWWSKDANLAKTDTTDLTETISLNGMKPAIDSMLKKR